MRAGAEGARLLAAGRRDPDRQRRVRQLLIGAAPAGGGKRGQEAAKGRVAVLLLVRRLEVRVLERAAQDEPPLGARRGDVDEPRALLGLLGALLGMQVVELPEADRLAGGERQAHPEARGASGAAGNREVAVAMPLGQAALQVRHCHDAELESLGGVHGHDPHPVVALGGHRRHALALVADRAGLGCGQEPRQIAAVVPLELASQAHELADVRHAPLTIAPREQLQVVVERVHRALDEALDRRHRRGRAQGGEDRAEALERRRVLGGDRIEPLGLELRGLSAGAAVAPLDERPDVAALAD